MYQLDLDFKRCVEEFVVRLVCYSNCESDSVVIAPAISSVVWSPTSRYHLIK